MAFSGIESGIFGLQWELRLPTSNARWEQLKTTYSRHSALLTDFSAQQSGPQLYYETQAMTVEGFSQLHFSSARTSLSASSLYSRI